LVDWLPGGEFPLRITPLDIRNHPFGKKVRGYDPEEVDAFLAMVAEDYEAVVRESETLRKQLAKLEARVEECTANESVLQETLTTAHKLSEDLKRTAMKEAEAMIGQAEIRGEKILDAAHRRVARLEEDIREMKGLRGRISNTVRATIETHLALLDGLSQDTPEEIREERGRKRELPTPGDSESGPKDGESS
jgi:cell division initiation protein